MSERISLADRAVSLCALIAENEQMLDKVNDYGDPTGFCAEHDQIVNDAHNLIGMLSARAYTLKRRFSLVSQSDNAAIIEIGQLKQGLWPAKDAEIERWKNAYENMKDFAVTSGLDITCYGEEIKV